MTTREMIEKADRLAEDAARVAAEGFSGSPAFAAVYAQLAHYWLERSRIVPPDVPGHGTWAMPEREVLERFGLTPEQDPDEARAEARFADERIKP
jgi:hypothetical protein